MFDTETVSTWHKTLQDDSWHVRVRALKVLGLIIFHGTLPLLGRCLCLSGPDDLRQLGFDAETVAAWRTMLHDDYWVIRQEALKILGHAIYHSMLPLLRWSVTHGGTDDLHQQMFDTETVSTWRSMLHDDFWNVRQEALQVLRHTIDHSALPLLRWCLCLQQNR